MDTLQARLVKYQAKVPAIFQAIKEWIGPAPCLPKPPKKPEKTTLHTHGEHYYFSVSTTPIIGPSVQKEWQEHDPKTERDTTFTAVASNLDGQPSKKEMDRYLECWIRPENVTAFAGRFLEGDKLGNDLLELVSSHLQDRGILKMLVAYLLAFNLTFKKKGEGDAPVTKSRLYDGQPDHLVCARTKVVCHQIWPLEISQSIRSLSTQSPLTSVLTLLTILKLGDLVVWDDNWRAEKSNGNLEALLFQPAVELCRAFLSKPDETLDGVRRFFILHWDYLENIHTAPFDGRRPNSISGLYIGRVTQGMELALISPVSKL